MPLGDGVSTASHSLFLTVPCLPYNSFDINLETKVSILCVIKELAGVLFSILRQISAVQLPEFVTIVSTMPCAAVLQADVSYVCEKWVLYN